MKIVIDIPNDYYITIKQAVEHGQDFRPYNLIANGTPLPEHHGDLIDRQRLQKEMEKDKRKAMSFVDLTDFVWLAPTIIEGSHSEKWESAEEKDSLIVDDLIDTSIPVRNCRECKHHVPAEGKEIFGCESWKCEFEKRGE